MLIKKRWEFSDICIIDIFVSNNFIGVGELIPINKSHGMNFLIYVQHIYLFILDTKLTHLLVREMVGVVTTPVDSIPSSFHD